MKEKLYTIPVNDAFNIDCECPLCVMYRDLETNAIDFTLGPSYMEEDIRSQTDQLGFCRTHYQKLYDYGNRLGCGLILSTHLKKKNEEDVTVLIPVYNAKKCIKETIESIKKQKYCGDIYINIIAIN